MAPAGHASGHRLIRHLTPHSELTAAYLATTYTLVHRDGRQLDTRIGQPDPAIDAILDELSTPRAALITAHNPLSQRLSRTENAKRNARLFLWLQRFGARTLAAVSVADTGDWPAEPGWLIADVEPALAQRIAALARQAAWVGYAVGQAPRLYWANPAAAGPEGQ